MPRRKCKGPTCGREILLAMDEDRKWIPLDTSAPIYRVLREGTTGGEDRCIRMTAGEVGVLHHATCKDVGLLSKTPKGAATAPALIGPRHWEREVRDPSSGDVRLERAEELSGPWVAVARVPGLTISMARYKRIADVLEEAGLLDAARMWVIEQLWGERAQG